MKRVLVFSLAAMLLVAFAPSASAEQEYNFWDTWSFTRYVGCNGDTGEWVEFVLDIHETGRLTWNYNHVSLGSHLNYHATGLGLSSGAKYVYLGASNSSFEHTFNNGAWTRSNHLTFKLNGQGGAPDLFLRFLEHITITPNGDVTSFIDNVEGGCK